MPTESDRRGRVRDWLTSNGLVPEEEFETGDGPVDLYLGGRRVLIETKKGERLRKGPHAHGTGSRGNESAFEQLQRYVIAERRREQVHLEDNPADQWIGCITDSEVWWIWVWPPYGSGDAATKVREFFGIAPDDTQKDRLVNRFRRIVGKIWIPPDPTDLFRTSLGSLKALYSRRKELRSTRTQRALWLEQLKAGGNAPESDVDEIFAIHTMLILISRMVSVTTGGNPQITDGFVQWMHGEEHYLGALREIVDSYDWRRRPGDVLRALYMGFIPPEHRKVYGEYFTPDWLAEKICRTVIDDGYLSEQVEKHQTGLPVSGVLDPTCGSGTFLYHAARLIMESDAVRRSYMEQKEVAAFVSRMIRGMDIHPVAVEMARANMHRLLPNMPDDDIWIYQGDALLTQRPESRFHSRMGGDFLALFSSGNLPLILPKSFLGDMSAIGKFVKSANDDSGMPPGLGHGLAEPDMEQLRAAHDQMREIIRKESNGIWAWYIRNQAAPMLLRDEKVGRIVSNPPWPRINEIPVESRKNEIKGMAKELGLWVGGSAATSFSIAALFVDRCTDMYLAESGRSGWLLQHGALFSGGWKGLRTKVGNRITGMWNLKRVAFKGTPSCVMLFGADTPNRDLIKVPRAKVKSSDSWDAVESKTRWAEWQTGFPAEKSRWLNRDGKPVARNGATIFPHCLVLVGTMATVGEKADFETVPSMHRPWRELGAQRGAVPSEWVRECLFFRDLFPFIIPKFTRCILPISGGGWDPSRAFNPYWRNATDLYAAYRSRGSGTPKTLEGNLNFGDKLFKQLGHTGDRVVYNSSGDVLHAARISGRHVVEHALFSVPCSSPDEARFLVAILNADAMLPAFRAARKSDRHFVTHLWREVPIPRYDDQSQLHRDLAEHSECAESVARRTWEEGRGGNKMRDMIRQALRDDGVAGRIDDACRQLFPRHV